MLEALREVTTAIHDDHEKKREGLVSHQPAEQEMTEPPLDIRSLYTLLTLGAYALPASPEVLDRHAVQDPVVWVGSVLGHYPSAYPIFACKNSPCDDLEDMPILRAALTGDIALFQHEAYRHYCHGYASLLREVLENVELHGSVKQILLKTMALCLMGEMEGHTEKEVFQLIEEDVYQSLLAAAIFYGNPVLLNTLLKKISHVALDEVLLRVAEMQNDDLRGDLQEDYKRALLDMARILIDAGANVNAKNREGNTPLLLTAIKWRASQHPFDLEMVALFLAVPGINPVKNKKGERFFTHYEDVRAALQAKFLQEDRPLSKLAAAREVRGGSERRTGTYMAVFEDSSPNRKGKVVPAAVEFGKRSNASTPSQLLSPRIAVAPAVNMPDAKVVCAAIHEFIIVQLEQWKQNREPIGYCGWSSEPADIRLFCATLTLDVPLFMHLFRLYTSEKAMRKINKNIRDKYTSLFLKITHNKHQHPELTQLMLAGFMLCELEELQPEIRIPRIQLLAADPCPAKLFSEWSPFLIDMKKWLFQKTEDLIQTYLRKFPTLQNNAKLENTEQAIKEACDLQRSYAYPREALTGLHHCNKMLAFQWKRRALFYLYTETHVSYHDSIFAAINYEYFNGPPLTSFPAQLSPGRADFFLYYAMYIHQQHKHADRRCAQHEKVIRYFLASGADIETCALRAVWLHDFHALIWALQCDWEKVCRMQDRQGKTLLFLALTKANKKTPHVDALEIASLLWRYGADPHAQNSDAKTSVSEYPHLLQKIAGSQQVQPGNNLWRALRVSRTDESLMPPILYCDLEALFSSLAKRGHTIEYDESGNSPLLIAAKLASKQRPNSVHMRMVDTLLAYGADPRERNSMGETLDIVHPHILDEMHTSMMVLTLNYRFIQIMKQIRTNQAIYPRATIDFYDSVQDLIENLVRSNTSLEVIVWVGRKQDEKKDIDTTTLVEGLMIALQQYSYEKLQDAVEREDSEEIATLLHTRIECPLQEGRTIAKILEEIPKSYSIKTVEITKLLLARCAEIERTIGVSCGINLDTLLHQTLEGMVNVNDRGLVLKGRRLHWVVDGHWRMVKLLLELGADPSLVRHHPNVLKTMDTTMEVLNFHYHVVQVYRQLWEEAATFSSDALSEDVIQILKDRLKPSLLRWRTPPVQMAAFQALNTAESDPLKIAALITVIKQTFPEILSDTGSPKQFLASDNIPYMDVVKQTSAESAPLVSAVEEPEEQKDEVQPPSVQLREAISRGEMASVKQIVMTYGNNLIEQPDDRGRTPLYFALEAILLKKTERQHTLHLLIPPLTLEIVKFLLEKGANPLLFYGDKYQRILVAMDTTIEALRLQYFFIQARAIVPEEPDDTITILELSTEDLKTRLTQLVRETSTSFFGRLFVSDEKSEQCKQAEAVLKKLEKIIETGSSVYDQQALGIAIENLFPGLAHAIQGGQPRPKPDAEASSARAVTEDKLQEFTAPDGNSGFFGRRVVPQPVRTGLGTSFTKLPIR